MSVHGYRHAMICIEKDVMLKATSFKFHAHINSRVRSNKPNNNALLLWRISEPTPIPLTGLQQNDCPSHATISYPGNLNSSPALPPEPTLPLQGSPQGTVEFHGVVGGTLCPVYQGVYRKTPVIGKFSSNRYGWLLL